MNSPSCPRLGPPWEPELKGVCACCDAEWSTDDNIADCSACGAVICEACADKGECEQCDHIYCDKCVKQWIPANGFGLCMSCINKQHQVPWQFFGAIGGTG